LGIRGSARGHSHSRLDQTPADRVAGALKAVISPHDGPRDGAILKFYSDAVAVVWEPLRVNYLGLNRVFVQGSHSHLISSLPCVVREYARAMRTDVISERPLSIGRRTYCWCEAQYDDDWQPPFHSASARSAGRRTSTISGWEDCVRSPRRVSNEERMSHQCPRHFVSPAKATDSTPFCLGTLPKNSFRFLSRSPKTIIVISARGSTLVELLQPLSHLIAKD
jgi:hypothetical protein